MAIITRPIKLGGGTDYVAGNDEIAQEFNDDANTIYTDYNGNITNANCAAAMGLIGSKLADYPNGITTNKINDLQVTGGKIANDATMDGSRAITTNHIKDANITKGKLSPDIPLSVFKGYFVEDIAISYPVISERYHAFSITYYANGANYNIAVGKIANFLSGIGESPIVLGTVGTVLYVPVTPIPIATKEIISCTIYTDQTPPWSQAQAITGRLRVISVDKV